MKSFVIEPIVRFESDYNVLSVVIDNLKVLATIKKLTTVYLKYISGLGSPFAQTFQFQIN